MTVIYSYIPGQISLSNYQGGDPVVDVAFDAGQYAKVEGNQLNKTLTANHTHMPNPYQPNNSAHAATIFGELDRQQWQKGILMSVPWGETETSPGVYDWTFIDFVFNTIRGLQRTTGLDKKVLLLLDLRHLASLTGLEEFIPVDLLTQNMSVNGGYYKNTTTFQPSQTNPIVNANKYDHVWCYEAANPNAPGGPVEPRGYNLNLYKFTAAAGTNTLKTRFYAFLAAIAARYGEDEVFAGMVMTEAAAGEPFVAYESGNSRNAHYEGRKNIMKYLKSIFPKRLVAECANFDAAYYTELTAAGAADGLVANKLAFTTANCHLGTNLNLGNINPVLVGKVPVIMQVQGLDMRTMSGNRGQYYNWPTNPTQKLSGDGINYNDPPITNSLGISDSQWMFNRVSYFNANYLVFQRNEGSATYPDQLTWSRWKTFMNAGPYVNDPYGGMNSTRPQFVG